MGKNTTSPQISLSLKDLEKLGVIKKKIKRKRRKVKKALEAVMGGVKSDSNHLQKGYINNFQNTSNLSTEAQRLQNNLLTNAQNNNHTELIHRRLEDEKYKNQIHDALGTLYEAYTKKSPYSSNYMIEELPDDVDDIAPTRYSDLRNRHSFYETSDNIDVPRTDGSEYHFKGEQITEESVAHQSLDALKNIQDSVQAAGGGGSMSGSPRTPKSEDSKQSSIFSMFNAIRSPAKAAVAYEDEKIFPSDAQKTSPDKVSNENPMIKPKSKPATKMAGISPRTGVRLEALNSLRQEAISLGIPEDEVIHETRQAEIKKTIKRFTDQRDWNNHLGTLKNTYLEYSTKLSKPTNPHLLEYPSDVLLKAEIKKLRAVAKKQNIDLD